MMRPPLLELYFYKSCPYCQIVLEVIEELKIKVQYFDTRLNRSYRDRLLADTGMTMVPCLYIDGKPMHESADIIDWLRENAPRLEKT